MKKYLRILLCKIFLYGCMNFVNGVSIMYMNSVSNFKWKGISF